MIQMFRDWFKRYFSDPQVIILIILLGIGFWGIYLLKDMLTPVFAAVVIAYLLEGIVTRLRRFRIPRAVLVPAVFLLFMMVLLLLIFGLLPLLFRQTGELLQELPGMIVKGQRELMHLPQKYPELVTEAQINQLIHFVASEVTQFGQLILSVSLASVRSLITLIVYLILVPLLVFFFLKDRNKILHWLQYFLPRNRILATEVWHEVDREITNYIRGKLWEILIVGGVSYATFALLKLKFALLLGLLVGLSVLIPYVGVTVTTLPVALIAFLQWGFGPEFTYVLVAYAIIQLLDGNLLAHLLLSGVVNLHPVAIIVATLFFGSLWGIWGLFFAIPLATLVHAVIKAWIIAVKGQPADSAI